MPDLEQVTDYFGKLNVAAIQRNFDTLAEAGVGAGGKSVEIRFGVANVTWPGGSPFSNLMTISHGLGRVPAVVVGSMGDGGGAQFSTLVIVNYTATSFQAEFHTDDGSAPANTVVSKLSWIAVG